MVRESTVNHFKLTRDAKRYHCIEGFKNTLPHLVTNDEPKLYDIAREYGLLKKPGQFAYTVKKGKKYITFGSEVVYETYLNQRIVAEVVKRMNIAYQEAGQ